jgi:hypothetical protein
LESKPAKTVICGLISAKRADGEPTGYKPFAFDPEKQLLALPPEAQHDLDVRDPRLQETGQKLLSSDQPRHVR